MPHATPTARRIATAIVTLSYLLVACAGPTTSDRAQTTPGTSRGAETTETTGALTNAAQSSGARVVRTVRVGGFLDGLAEAGGRLWAADLDAGRVVEFDPRGGRVVRTVAAGTGPLTVVGAGAAVWVADYKGSAVRRIDAVTGTVTATVTTPGQAPCGLVAATGRLWVFDQSDGTALTLDAVTGASQHRFSTDARSGWATAAFGGLWVPDFLGGSGQILRLDAGTRRVTAHVDVGQQPIAVAAGFGSLWSTVTSTSTVARIDPTSDRVTAQIPLRAAGPTGLLVTADAVWVMSFDGRAITRIDPHTNRVVGTLALPGRAENAVEAGPDIWVTTADGTLVAVRPV